ncbi:glycine--tRNA ligase [Thermofilum pendens]|uniref:glycine--tRNA ligase n=1 Tax=Thermofilum pendens (strain DSM 2475 / Hrk 5) TaxID=368408 RepID=A1RWW8_THEPD|nr:glycine--tRNA ligase [Thermofilum pendens]ABL77698.1 glycyl-tRNA synthetase [Thermofilum pendens Hrk 5]
MEEKYRDITLDELTDLCIRRGIVFPSGRIYGGLAGFYDYGPVGVELERNILNDWWKWFVETRDDIYGIDGAIITHPRTWEASGHVESFIDYIVTCTSCGAEYRADHLLEEVGVKIPEYSLETIKSLIENNNVRCPACGGKLSEPRKFNLMFDTQVGPRKSMTAYLRPETAQLIFTNFKNVVFTMGATLPFGIAQIGKAFRNEISPRNFLFRLREFTQMEIEYFVNPEKLNECPYFKEVEELRVNFLSAEEQERGVSEAKSIKLGEAVETGVIKNAWHAYWIGESLRWLWSLGLRPERLRVREHVKTELAHYAVQTFDIEYFFPYMGWKEIEGIANRSDYDLKRHQEYSGEALHIVDNGKTVIPYVIEPSFGLERILLAVLTDSYVREERRTYLRLKPRIAPFKCAVFPLVKRDGLDVKAREIYNQLKKHFRCYYDEDGSIGRRYAKADEIGVPFSITIDGQTLRDDTVTIRFRDTKEQIRERVENLKARLSELIATL